MKINYCCGRRVRDGWWNIDAVHNPKAQRAPDLIFAMRFNSDGTLLEPTPMPDGCADVVEADHAIEHFHRWEAPQVIAEWRRLLKPGGLLILELPNLESACRNVLAGASDQMGMWPLYGDPGHRDPYMIHRWAYTPKTIQELLVGFRTIQMFRPVTHGARADRDMRVEGTKC